jgi:hypothetical protein
MLPLGSGPIDDQPYERILAIDKLFSDAIASLPPYFSLSAPVPTNAPPFFAVQRQVILLAFHARRARQFRPFLTKSPVSFADKRFEQFRGTCIASAREVLSLASAIIPSTSHTASQADTKWPRRMSRSATVINHLFLACVILATDPAFSSADSSNGSKSTDTDAMPNQCENKRRKALINACHVLENAAEESSIAASLLRSFVGILKKHRVHGIAGRRGSDSVKNQDMTLPLSHDMSIATTAGHGMDFRHVTVQQSNVVTLEMPGIVAEWDISQQDPLDASGIWDDLMNLVPPSDEWGLLFADLDSIAARI